MILLLLSGGGEGVGGGGEGGKGGGVRSWVDYLLFF